MKTLGMMSIIFITIAAPVITARNPDGRRGFRQMIVLLVGFIAAYVGWLTLVHVNFFVPHR
jgi:hypothetical protein